MQLLNWFYIKLTLAQVDVRYGYDNYGLWRSFNCIAMDRPLLFLCQCFRLLLEKFRLKSTLFRCFGTETVTLF